MDSNKSSQADLKAEISSLKGLLMNVTDQMSKANSNAHNDGSPAPSKNRRQSVEFRHMKSELDAIKVHFQEYIYYNSVISV